MRRREIRINHQSPAQQRFGPVKVILSALIPVVASFQQESVCFRIHDASDSRGAKFEL